MKWSTWQRTGRSCASAVRPVKISMMRLSKNFVLPPGINLVGDTHAKFPTSATALPRINAGLKVPDEDLKDLVGIMAPQPRAPEAKRDQA